MTSRRWAVIDQRQLEVPTRVLRRIGFLSSRGIRSLEEPSRLPSYDGGGEHCRIRHSSYPDKFDGDVSRSFRDDRSHRRRPLRSGTGRITRLRRSEAFFPR